jgi:hypothetical protein
MGLKAMEKKEWVVLIIVLTLLVLWVERPEYREAAADLGCVSDLFSGYQESADLPALSLAVVQHECGSQEWTRLMALSPLASNSHRSGSARRP